MSWKLAQNNEISEVRKAYGQTIWQGRQAPDICMISIQSIPLILASVKQIW